MFHLAQQDGVAQVQICRRGIESRLHAQRPSRLGSLGQTLPQVLFADQFRQSFFDVGELFVDSRRGHTPIVGSFADARKPQSELRREF